jgi:ubiquinone/menaquinone biosynthesis C-methylase UbiE
VKPGAVVLDAACGSGYGTQLLAEKANSVTGLGINDHALRYAMSRHLTSNTTFLKQNLKDSVGPT